MDLSNIKLRTLADNGIDVHIYHPGTKEPLYDDKENPMIIRVAGSDSAIFKTALNARIRQAALNKKKKEDVNIEDMERKGAELIAKATLGWQNIQFDGKHLPFSYQAALNLYSDPEWSWIKDQLDAAMADRSELFKA